MRPCYGTAGPVGRRLGDCDAGPAWPRDRVAISLGLARGARLDDGAAGPVGQRQGDGDAGPVGAQRAQHQLLSRFSPTIQ